LIRKALSGREVEPAIAFRVILYTYCSVFHVDPAIAQNSPMKLMMEMLQVHSEVEQLKSKELEKEMKKNDRRANTKSW
jgi:hypothetical protein|tara:strand:- start:2467 stop:2700 length:234 start_codon:yes stop_codon:yes gene_type:complete